MLTLNSITTILIFISQLYIISYYLPNRIIQRMRFIITNYPPSEYPKMYVDPVEEYYRRIFTYQVINMIIFIAGIVLITLVSYNSENGKIEDSIPLIFGLVQFAPYMFLEITQLKKFRIMRLSDNRTKRVADLSKRRFMDYTEKPLLYTTLIIIIALFFIELFLPNLEINIDKKSMIRLSTIIFVHIFWAVIIIWQIYGKKLDPYQSKKDREKQIYFTIKSTLLTSISISVFYILIILVEDFNLDYLSFYINSVYFQFIALFSIGGLLKNIKLSDIDFEVYKVDSEEN